EDEAEPGRQRRLQREEAARINEERQRIAQQQIEIEPGADRHEEEAEQQALEGLHRHLDLAAELRLGEQQAGDEGAELHRESRGGRRDSGGDDDEQAGRDEKLGRLRRGDEPEERPQQQPAGQDHADERETGRREGREQLPRRERILGLLQNRDREQHRRDREILREQRRKGGASGGLIEAARLGEHAQHEAGGGHGQRRAHDQRWRRIEFEPEMADSRKRRGGYEHLRKAEPE